MLSVSPESSTTSPTDFKLTWSGLTSPASNDWIGQYCVGSAGPSANGPWAYLSTCPGWASGSCSLQLTVSDPLAQPGCKSLEFRIYRDPSPYRLVVASPPVSWNTSGAGGDATPRQLRLAYGASPQTTMALSWTSNDGATPALVQLGAAPGDYSLGNFSAAEAVTYTEADSCGAPRAYSFPGFFHHALLTGLQPATRYYARTVQGGAVSAETSFATGKPVGRGGAVRAVWYADMDIGGGDGAAGTAARVAARARNTDFFPGRPG